MRSFNKLQPILPRFAVAMAAAALMLILPSAPAQAQTVGSCEIGSASSDLDANNVRARLYNAGNLYWKGSGFVYVVPKEGSASSIFAGGIWLGGLVNGEEHFAGTNYGPFEYWPGPLDENGNPPADCSQYDRIFSITSEAMEQYELTGEATQDMLDWPAELGAPVVDGDDNPNNYNLEGGDRPQLLGDETLWWVMNDVGNVKGWSETPPIGIEVQVTAFSYRTADALNNTTFYKYKLIYKGSAPFEEAYFGVFLDPDLGNALDDFVGVDSTLGLGFAYNGDDFDEGGSTGYGSTPPAVGLDFFQGPLVPAPGETWEDPDGTTYPDMRRLPMTHFHYWNNDSSPYGSPDGSAGDGYRYLQSIWKDGTPVTLGGTGYNPGSGNEEVNYIFPGDPVTRSFWSEENTDGEGGRNTPYDRRLLTSTGPFTMMPGDVQEIVFGIVWSRSVGRLASVAQLRADDILAQGAFNADFDVPAPPDQPDLNADALDGAVALSWGYEPNDNNYLESYEIESPFLLVPDPADGDLTYNFEGYKIYQYSSATDGDGEVIATFDVANNVTTIVDQAIDLETGGVVTVVVANGSDSGVQQYIIIDGLTNFTEYYFGVQAYAYNGNSQPKIYASPITRVEVEPVSVASRGGGTELGSDFEEAVAAERLQGVGDPTGISAVVVSPLAVTGDQYRVRFYNAQLNDTTTVLTYDIINQMTNEVEVSGEDFIAERGENLKFGRNVAVIDGLAFNVNGPAPALKSVQIVANASGELSPPVGGAAGFQGFPLPNTDYGRANPSLGSAWFLGPTEFLTGHSYGDFLANVMVAENAVPYDWEVRFTEEGGKAAIFPASTFGSQYLIDVPFELWNIGINTPDDPSDDVRYFPGIFDLDFSVAPGGGAFNILADAGVKGTFGCCGGDSGTSSGTNDPQTDGIDWLAPMDLSPGESGYQAIADALAGDPNAVDLTTLDAAFIAQAFISWNGGDAAADQVAPYDSISYDLFTFPETGTIFQMITTKPIAPGDVFALNTAEFAPGVSDDSTAVANLEDIGIVPNPYKGASAYEIGARRDVVKFTNLPDRANVKVFTLAGTLVWEETLSTFNNEWDLRTDSGLKVASGLYLIHIEVPDVGETILKFGVVPSRTQLDLL